MAWGIMDYFVVVAGNIGVGKSSLTKLVSQRFGWEPLLEPIAENPYLADFYADMKRWSFHSQVRFLAHRLGDYRLLNERGGSVVQDRSVYEDAEIFARNLYRQGLMDARDWECYYALYQSLVSLLPPPQLVVYLRAEVPTLQHRIALRNRDFERAIDPAYLEQLNTLYEEWVASLLDQKRSVLTIDTNDLDFVHDAAQFNAIVEQIQDVLPR